MIQLNLRLSSKQIAFPRNVSCVKCPYAYTHEEQGNSETSWLQLTCNVGSYIALLSTTNINVLHFSNISKVISHQVKV